MTMVALPAQGDELWPHDIGKIKERGELVVAQYGGTQPVFFFYDDEMRFPDRVAYKHEGRRLVGCDIFLADEAAKHLGVRLKLDRSSKDYESVCRLVASGKADLGISMLSVTLRRAQYVRFSKPYAVAETGVLIDRLYASEARSAHHVIELLKRRATRIGIVKGCSYVDFAKDIFRSSSLVYYRDFDSMTRGILKGEIHAIYDDEFLLKTTLYQDPKLAVRLKYVPIPGMEDPLSIAVAPKNLNLLAFVDILLGTRHVKSEIKRQVGTFTLMYGAGKPPSIEGFKSYVPSLFRRPAKSQGERK